MREPRLPFMLSGVMVDAPVVGFSMIGRGSSCFRFVLAAMAVWGAVLAPASYAGDPPGISQKWCPVLPEERIDPGISVEYEGRRVYFCCARCKAKFLADPERYAGNLPEGANATPTHDEGGHDHAHDHATPATGWRRWVAYLGRFHVMVVHFPVALLLLAGLCELAALRDRWRSLGGLVPALAGTGALASLAAMLLGFAHAMDTRYHGRLAEFLDWHRTGGIATTVAAFVAWALVVRRSRDRTGSATPTRVAVLLTAALVAITGHLGGSLVFGPDYLVP